MRLIILLFLISFKAFGQFMAPSIDTQLNIKLKDGDANITPFKLRAKLSHIIPSEYDQLDIESITAEKLQATFFSGKHYFELPPYYKRNKSFISLGGGVLSIDRGIFILKDSMNTYSVFKLFEFNIGALIEVSDEVYVEFDALLAPMGMSDDTQMDMDKLNKITLSELNILLKDFGCHGCEEELISADESSFVTNTIDIDLKIKYRKMFINLYSHNRSFENQLIVDSNNTQTNRSSRTRFYKNVNVHTFGIEISREVYNNKFLSLDILADYAFTFINSYFETRKDTQTFRDEYKDIQMSEPLQPSHLFNLGLRVRLLDRVVK